MLRTTFEPNEYVYENENENAFKTTRSFAILCLVSPISRQMPQNSEKGNYKPMKCS